MRTRVAVLLSLVALVVGLVAVGSVASGRGSSGSGCGSVDGGRGARLAARVAGVRVSAVVGGRLRGRLRTECLLQMVLTGSAPGYTVAFTLRLGRSAPVTATLHSPTELAFVALGLDRRARDQLRHGANVSAMLRMIVTSPRGKAGVVSRRLTLSSHTVRTVTALFVWTGAEQRFTVPAGVYRLHVTAVGAPGVAGQAHEADKSVPGGKGAIVSATLGVHPGEVLYVEVGGEGNAGDNPKGAEGGDSSSGVGGCPQFGCSSPGGGGGASDVRTISSDAPGTVASRLLIAAGGGGGGGPGASPNGNTPGGAGGNAGQPGHSAPGGGHGGQPGKSGAGGAGGEGSGDGGSGAAGAIADGGNGGNGGNIVACPPFDGCPSPGGGGGGGGGGRYGGGGGGGGASSSSGQDASGPGGGGGGGASLVPADGTLALANQPVSVTITYTI